MKKGFMKRELKIIEKALKKVFHQPVYYVLTIFTAVNVLFVYYFVLTRTTTWEVFWASNIAIYNYLQVVLSVVNALLIGIAISFLVYVLGERKKQSGSSLLNALGSFVFSAAATGCTVCGAILLPTLGIAASLTALPFGGLEIKTLSILLLGYALYEYSKTILGLCKANRLNLISFKKGHLELNLNKKTLPQATPVFVLLAFVVIVYSLPKLPQSWKLSFSRSAQAASTTGVGADISNVSTDNLFSQINPAQGYEIKASFGDLGPKMIEMGVIDLQKFKDVYERSGQPLTQEQLDILTKGSSRRIKIDSQSSYFLLNFFWAVGLANKSKILTEGDMTKYGKDQLGYFASTGGWTLSKTNAMDYYARGNLIPLTPQQEALVQQVASNIYRPCCNNSTAFPDCNHGMALLGVLQLMAANGATADEMYEAAKYFNSYWFPQSYYDLALYFKAREGTEFKDIDPKVLLSANYSSVSGWQRAKRWLQDNGVVKQAPKGGAGCGV